MVELKGVRYRDWNTDHPLVFTACIPPTEEDLWKLKGICVRIACQI